MVTQQSGETEKKNLFSKLIEGLKGILGLSAIAYIAGFIVVNAHFLSWGFSEADLVDAKYIAAGAIFLFVGLPVTLFPYLRGVASLNSLYHDLSGEYLSEQLLVFYESNKQLIRRHFGPLIVIVVMLLTLFALEKRGIDREAVTAVGYFVAWYVASNILSAVAVRVFNLAFFWRANMLVAKTPFWKAFKPAFLKSSAVSFRKGFRLTAGRDPTEQEVEVGLRRAIVSGLAAEGFIASALYKGLALFLLNAATFGYFVYPNLPPYIGGGKIQTVILLLSADKSAGLTQLGLPGKQIDSKAKVEGKDLKEPKFQLLTEPLPLLTKTSEGYFVLVPRGSALDVVKIPTSAVDGVSYAREK
jgi:hypothetical protein